MVMIDVVKGMPEDKRLELYEARFMALANAAAVAITAHKYLIEQLTPLSENRPHREHIERVNVLLALEQSKNRLYTYFLGD